MVCIRKILNHNFISAVDFGLVVSERITQANLNFLWSTSKRFVKVVLEPFKLHWNICSTSQWLLTCIPDMNYS